MTRQTLEQFKAQLKTQNAPKTKKIRNSWGVYDYYKYYRTHRPNEHKYVLYECVYFAIIRKVNKILADEICKGFDVELPHRLGILRPVKRETRTWEHNGKLRTNKLVDWDKTLELWYNDEQAYKNKYLIYRDVKDVPKCIYDKRTAIFKNKYYYEYSPCRDLKLKLIKSFNTKALELESIFNRAKFNDIKGLYDEY